MKTLQKLNMKGVFNTKYFIPFPILRISSFLTQNSPWFGLGKVKIHNLIYRFFGLFFFLYGTQNLNAQSVTMMKLLPADPSIIKELEVPKGTRKWVVVKNEILSDTFQTDTLSIKIYNPKGQISESVSFSFSGIRETHYYFEYPNPFTERFHYISKDYNHQDLYNYVENLKDSSGQMIYSRTYQVNSDGMSNLVSEGKYSYDNQKRLVYNCSGCNSNTIGGLKSYYKYKNGNLDRLIETFTDTLQSFRISEMAYDKEGRITQYQFKQYHKGDTNLMQESKYSYENGQLVKHIQYNSFEKVWREFIYEYDSLGRLIQSFQIIDKDTTAVTYYYEGTLLKRSFLTTTFLYSDGIVLFGSKFGNHLSGTKHTTEIKYTYDIKGNRILTEYYWDGLLRRRYRNVFE